MEDICFHLNVSLGNYVLSVLYIYPTLSLQISQMSTRHFNTSQVPKMTCSLLAFCLALTFSIALGCFFFSLSPCLLASYYAGAWVLCDVPSCFWPSSTTLLKNVRYSCTNLAVLMKLSPCVWCPICAGILFLSASLRKTLITRITKLPKIHPRGLPRHSSELKSVLG